MSMKRRGFLGMLGAVLSVPALPSVALAKAPGSAFKAAILHAQKFPVISVAGLANRGGLSTVQAEAMIKELAARDMVKLVGPSKSGSVRAASKILTHDPWGLGRTSQSQKSVTKPESRQAHRSADENTQSLLVEPWLAHLRQLCVDRGMTLHLRCFAAGAA